MKEETILEAILPVAQQNDTCLLGTTTPSGTDHIVSTMISAKDKKGNPVIATVRIGKPCEECRQLKILCTHAENTVAEGTSRKKRARYAALYEGREHIKMREYQGEIGDVSRPIFQPRWIHLLKERPLLDLPPVIDMLFLTCDPAQGGACEWATIGAYYDRSIGSMVICLLDAIRLDKASPSYIHDQMLASVKTLRAAHPKFQDVPIVYCVESAPKMFAEMIDQYAEEISSNEPVNVTCMREGPNGDTGVPKDNVNTRMMADMSAVFMENEAVYFSKYCVTSIENSDVEKEKFKLCSQLERIARKVDEKTGKIRIDGKDGGANDDYSVAFMMQPYWYQWFWKSTKPHYESVKKYSSGWRLPVTTEGFQVKEYDPSIYPEKERALKRQKISQDPAYLNKVNQFNNKNSGMEKWWIVKDSQLKK
jgi:hypothetical protein